MGAYCDDYEEDPLSLEDPIDWFYRKAASHGYSTECEFLIFSEFSKLHSLALRMWGVSFDDLKPRMSAENLRVEIIESDPSSKYLQINLHDNSEEPKVCSLRVEFDLDFYFEFYEIDSHGNLVALDYYDDYEMK